MRPAPYVFLAVAATLVLVVGPVREAAETVEVGIAFPRVETGYDVINEAEDAHSPFTPLTHPGFFLGLAALFAAAFYRARGYFRAWREREQVQPLWSTVAGDALPASVAIVAFLILSQIMEHSGQTEVLALGTANVTTPVLYAVLAPFIGALGSFMTSSNASSNIIFSPLQDTVAQAEGLGQETVLAGQHAGAAIGNAASPANVALGAGAAGVAGQVGVILRRTLAWSALATLAAGAGAVLLHLLG